MRKLFALILLIGIVFSVQANAAGDMDTQVAEYLADELTKYTLVGDAPIRISAVEFVAATSLDTQSQTAAGTACIATEDGNKYLLDFAVSTDGGLSLTSLTNLSLVVNYDKLGTKYDLKKNRK